MTEETEEERLAFAALDYTWSTSAADGTTLIGLCPNGAHTPVLYEDRFEYARRVEAVRLNEFRSAHPSCNSVGFVVMLFFSVLTICSL